MAVKDFYFMGKKVSTITLRTDDRSYLEGGVENALFDVPGRGRNAKITDDEKSMDNKYSFPKNG